MRRSSTRLALESLAQCRSSLRAGTSIPLATRVLSLLARKTCHPHVCWKGPSAPTMINVLAEAVATYESILRSSSWIGFNSAFTRRPSLPSLPSFSRWPSGFGVLSRVGVFDSASDDSLSWLDAEPLTLRSSSFSACASAASTSRAVSFAASATSCRRMLTRRSCIGMSSGERTDSESCSLCSRLSMKHET